MLMKAYFDESGHSASTNSVAVAGLAGFEYQWDGFDEEWRDVLRSAGVSMFHMTDFENRKKAFVGWDEHTQKRPLIARLMQAITRRKLIAVGTAVSVAFFESIPPDEYENSEFFEDPYHFALEETIHLLGGDVGPDFKATAVSVTLADQPEFRGQGRGYYAGSAALLYRGYLWPHAPYVPVGESARLQAADIVAYELRKACDDPPARRWPMQQLRTTNHCFLVKGWNGSEIFGAGVYRKRTKYLVLKVRT